MKKLVIFLDINGVLNSNGYFKTNIDYLESQDEINDMENEESRLKHMLLNLDESLVRNFNYLLIQLEQKSIDFEIWISSAWRRVFNVNEIAEALWWKGLDYEFKSKIVGPTPQKLSSMRCNEIHWALESLVEDRGVEPGDITALVIDDIPVISREYASFLRGRGFANILELNTSEENGLLFSEVSNMLRLIQKGFSDEQGA